MAIVLTIERQVIPGMQEIITGLLRQLRSRAVLRQGFISGETVVDVFNPGIFMTVSTWSSIADWELWKNDPERLEIIDQIDLTVQGSPRIRIWRDDTDAPPAGG